MWCLCVAINGYTQDTLNTPKRGNIGLSVTARRNANDTSIIENDLLIDVQLFKKKFQQTTNSIKKAIHIRDLGIYLDAPLVDYVKEDTLKDFLWTKGGINNISIRENKIGYPYEEPDNFNTEKFYFILLFFVVMIFMIPNVRKQLEMNHLERKKQTIYLLDWFFSYLLLLVSIHLIYFSIHFSYNETYYDKYYAFFLSQNTYPYFLLIYFCYLFSGFAIFGLVFFLSKNYIPLFIRGQMYIQLTLLFFLLIIFLLLMSGNVLLDLRWFSYAVFACIAMEFFLFTRFVTSTPNVSWFLKANALLFGLFFFGVFRGTLILVIYKWSIF